MSSFRKGNLRLAVVSLKASKARSFLTMLGIVIGVVSVITVVCIGQGVKNQIVSQVAHFGANIITIRPGTGKTGIGAGSLLAGNGVTGSASSLLSESDLQTVTQTPGVDFAVPLSITSGSATGDHAIISPLVIATGSHLPEAINQPVAQGGFFDDSTRNQIVLGQNIARKLFDDPVPLGQTVTYRGQQFIVTVIFSSFTATPFSLSANFNDAIFVPYAAAQTLNGGDLAMYQILAKTSKTASPAAIATAINTRLISAHGGAQQNTVLTANQATDNSDSIIHLLTMLIVGVAAIALIVGGVGIMNIMLVSVTERMHEIGLRKAIGATNKQILRQFVAEAFVLSATGAVIGIVVSCIVIGLLRLYTSLQPVIVWQVLVIAPIVAVVVGVFFGTIPALKAARKDPIEALRHE